MQFFIPIKNIDCFWWIYIGFFLVSETKRGWITLRSVIRISFLSPIICSAILPFFIDSNQGCVLLILFSHLVVMSVLAFNDSLFCVVVFFLLSSSAYRFFYSVMFPALNMLFLLEIFIYVAFAEKTSKLEFRCAPLSASLTACNNSRTCEWTSTKYYAVRVLTDFVGKLAL